MHLLCCSLYLSPLLFSLHSTYKSQFFLHLAFSLSIVYLFLFSLALIYRWNSHFLYIVYFSFFLVLGNHSILNIPFLIVLDQWLSKVWSYEIILLPLSFCSLFLSLSISFFMLSLTSEYIWKKTTNLFLPLHLWFLDFVYLCIFSLIFH